MQIYKKNMEVIIKIEKIISFHAESFSYMLIIS